jgi:magnesium-protoporphyrin O-methyltransferase
MADCCEPDPYQSVFTRRFARRTAKRYRNRGLSPAATRIVEFVTDHGVQGASVLEIGGGVGEIQVELLRRGASNVTNLELSTQYEHEAARLLAGTGLAGRVDRRFLDIAREPERVEPADVVVLHRVVCCYQDYQRLLCAAAQHATQLLVYSHPPDNPATRAVTWSENFARRVRGNAFRGYVHPPTAMIAAAEGDGLRMTYQHHSRDWDVVGLVR